MLFNAILRHGDSMSADSPPEEGGRGMTWYKALSHDELPEGRVTAVNCGDTTVAVTHYHGEYAALDNNCPHQGGPLGEGSIETGWLRCPWHGWDFDPLTGETPGPHDDRVQTFPVEEREDGIYVGFPEEAPHERTVSDVIAETLVNWGVRHVWGIVGHSNLGLADALRREADNGNLSYYGVRHEGAGAFAASAYGKLTGRPAACFSIAGPGATNMLTGTPTSTGRRPSRSLDRSTRRSSGRGTSRRSTCRLPTATSPNSKRLSCLTASTPNSRRGPRRPLSSNEVSHTSSFLTRYKPRPPRESSPAIPRGVSPSATLVRLKTPSRMRWTCSKPPNDRS